MYVLLTSPSDSPKGIFAPSNGSFCQHSVRRQGKLKTIQQHNADMVDEVSVCCCILYFILEKKRYLSEHGKKKKLTSKDIIQSGQKVAQTIS